MYFIVFKIDAMKNNINNLEQLSAGDSGSIGKLRASLNTLEKRIKTIEIG